MENFKEGIIHWNKTVFRNIFEQKKRCRVRLLGIQRAMTMEHRFLSQARKMFDRGNGQHTRTRG